MKYYKKYLKYKIKYINLKHKIQFGGAIPDDKMEIIEKSINIILMNNFYDLLDLQYEVGGYIDLSTNKMNITIKGAAQATIIQQTVMPLDDNMVNFHTHPNFIESIGDTSNDLMTKQHQENLNKVRQVASYADLHTCLNASLFYDNVDVIINKKGLFFYYAQKELIDFIKSNDQDEQQTIINEYIIPEISYIMHLIASSEHTDESILLNIFQENIRKVFKMEKENGEMVNLGFETYFHKL